MIDTFCLEISKNERVVWKIISTLLVLPTILRAQNTLGCGEMINIKCSCYTFENAAFLDCQDSNTKQVKNALKRITEVHSLSINDLDDSEEILGPHFVPSGVCVKHIHIARTSIREIDDEAFISLKQCLETLSIVSSKIKLIPQKSFSGLLKLISIELTSNHIEDIPSYSFYGLPLMKINVKQNMIRYISDSAFSSLELTLSEIDLSENNLTTFPIASIAKLRHLRSLRLSWNEMSSFPAVDDYDLMSLEFLDLSSNNFEFISEDCLKFCPSLLILSFHFNFINNIHYRAFHSLTHLKSLDLSHNKIKVLNTKLFENNKKIEFVDLGHNHLHHIHGLFCNMPLLAQVFLGNNNILEVPTDSFFNSTKINLIHLNKNSIHTIHSKSFSDLDELGTLRLDFNYITQVPRDIFSNNNLTILRLDNNNIIDLKNNTFNSQELMREIRINHNNLKYISKYNFISLTRIEEIYLNNNKITNVDSETFAKMPLLRYLSLHDNYLVEINDILPKPSSSLLTFHIDSNLLSSIKTLTFRYQFKLYHLGLTNNHVKFLSKNTFSNLTFLTRIELFNNEISVIDDFTFQQLRSARNLDLHKNYLRNVTNYTFVGLFELEDLNLSNNKITFIYNMAFDTLKKIRTLNLSFNPLKILHKNLFQHGLPLSSLYLDNCEVQQIENGTFEGMNNLKYFSLRNNSLKSTDLIYINIPSLKYLSLSFNIFDIILPVDSFSHLPLLEVLFLEHCNIETIFDGTFSLNKHLTKLNLAQNIIGGIPSTLFEAQILISEMNISNNFLDYVPFNTFNNLTLIETLDFADNLLPKIELSGFERLKKLKHLILRKNEIQSITLTKRIVFKDLLELDMSYNRLSTIPSMLFESFPKIQNINISYNDVIQFDFLLSHKNSGISLISLDLSKNPTVSWSIINSRDTNNTLLSNLYELHICKTNLSNLDYLSFDFFTNLQHLYLKNNKIRRLSISPFSKLFFLENLDLSFNKVTHLKTSNFRGLFKLNALCLSNNNIESIESFTEDLANLKLLDLSHNRLQNILNEDLVHLKELTVLYLAFNNIKYISLTAFNNLNKIINIDLEHNKLQTIPMEILISIETHIQEISIKDNVIICSCQRNNTWTWIQDHPKIIKLNSVTCLNEEYPKEKCDFPVITQMSIDKHKDNSVSVSWFIRNRTAVKSLHILYYDDDKNSDVTYNYIDKTETSTLVSDLKPNKNYIVCILTLDQPYNPLSILVDEDILTQNVSFPETKKSSNISRSHAASLISQSPSSECISFDTFTKHAVKLRPTKTFHLSSILNRRMGLIVGCCLGFVVFFVMVSVLLYTKIKERKRIAKSDPAWSEMNDYHSIQSKEEILQHSTTASTDNILLGMAKNRKMSLEQLK